MTWADAPLMLTAVITVMSWAVTAVAFVVSLRSLARENRNALEALRDHLDKHEAREQADIKGLDAKLTTFYAQNDDAHKSLERSVGRLEGAVKLNGGSR